MSMEGDRIFDDKTLNPLETLLDLNLSLNTKLEYIL